MLCSHVAQEKSLEKVASPAQSPVATLALAGQGAVFLRAVQDKLWQGLGPLMSTKPVSKAAVVERWRTGSLCC